jgi:hypothetical protein
MINFFALNDIKDEQLLINFIISEDQYSYKIKKRPQWASFN